MAASLTPIEVFCSFAEADIRWLEQLERHLTMLQQQQLISLWHKRKIAAGKDWQMEIDHHLNNASLILLLISPDFLASQYQHGVELRHAMRRHNEKKARVIPIWLRPCDYKGALFEKLAILPRSGIPLALWRNRDDGMAEIAREIREALQVPLAQPFSTPRVSNRIHRRVLGRHFPLIREPVGRDALLSQIKQQLTDPQIKSPFVVIHGQAGAGKTTLAAHLASDEMIHTSFPGGVLWADLGREPSLDNIVAIWASQLHADLSRATTISEKVERIQEKLGYTPFLLVLDDLWELDPKLQPLLGMAGLGCASLATTRNRKIATLLGNKTGSVPVLVEELDEDASLQLFLSLSHNKLTDRSVFTSLVKVAGGLPLTLELMGAYINSQLPLALSALQIQQELLRIEKHLYLPGDTSTRSISLQEAIERSVKNLPDRQTQQAFFALGAFAPKPATFSMEAMQFVTGANKEVLQNLYNRHLLHPASEEGNNTSLSSNAHNRYTLHQSIASFAQAHLSNNALARVKHRIYYQKQIERTVFIGQTEGGTRANIDWRTLFSDLPQIRAIRHTQYPASSFSIIVNRLASLVSWLRWFNLLPRWLKNVLSEILLVGLAGLRKGMHLVGKKHTEATLANYEGWLAAESGKRDKALEHYQRAHDLWTILDNPRGLAQVLDNLGKTYYMQAEYRHALKAYHQALTLRRVQRDLVGQAQTLTNLGPTLDMVGRINWAIQSYYTALSLYQKLPNGQDQRGEAFTLLHLGIAYCGLGEHEKAFFYLKQALVKHKQARNDVGRARTLTTLGWVYLDSDYYIDQGQQQAHLKVAMNYFQKALELQKKFGDIAWQASTLSRIGQVYTKQGKTAQALEIYLQALSLHQSVDHHAGLSATLGLLSNLLQKAGQDIWVQSVEDEYKSSLAHHTHIAAIFKRQSKSEQ